MGLALNYNNVLPGGTVSGVTPVTLSPVTTPQISVAASTVHGGLGQAYNGYAGGLVIDNAQTAGAGYNAYATTSADQVSVTPSLANGTVSGSVGMTQLSTPNNIITATFGHPTDGAKSAYLSDGSWAAQQQSVQSGALFSTGANAANGALVEGSHVSNVIGACTSCSYTSWGIWGGEAKFDGTARVDATPMVPVVMGKVKQDLYLLASPPTNAVYNGPAYGNVLLDNTTYANAVGTMTAHANLALATSQLISLAVNFPSASLPDGKYINISTLSPVDISQTGPAVFNSSNIQVLRNGSPVAGATAQMHGSLNGPLAQEIGGNYAVESPNLKVGGIFLGK